MSPTDDTLEFTPLFDLRGTPVAPASGRDAVAQPDSRRGMVYRLPAALHLAVEVALTTGRPLLLRGEPGTGKSSLAPYIARRLGWRYYEYVVSSTSTANDLLWRFDAVKRLADAQATTKTVKAEAAYVEPGVLWWALDRKSASEFATGAGGREPDRTTNEARDPDRAVVLIDEIDKAHPDLPNGLLVALGSNQITVPYLDKPIEIDTTRATPLPLPKGVHVSPVQIVITTNEERELPAAFVRRCVTFALQHPKGPELMEIARAQFDHEEDPFTKADETLALAIGARVDVLRKEAKAGMHKPSTAEFLDAFRACRVRKITPDVTDRRWQLIETIALAKRYDGSPV